jgi:hypothetical protein
MRRDYESLYVLAVAFIAFASAELMHASGFMAAFAAGLTVGSLDVELCDCFRDYGEATAEMLLLFAFVAFGASLIWTGLEVMSPSGFGFALVAVLARSAVLWITLPRGSLDASSRTLIVAFGPRALSSLLLVLLPVFAGIDGAMALVPYAALAVLLSVGLHGAMLWYFAQRYGGAGGRAGLAGRMAFGSPCLKLKNSETPASRSHDRRAKGARLEQRRVQARRLGAGSIRTIRRERGGAGVAAERLADRVLRVKRRGHKRPGGANASRGWIHEGPRTDWWVGRVAGCREGLVEKKDLRT